MTAIAILFRMTGLQEVYGRQRRSKGSEFGRWGHAIQVDRNGHGRGYEGQSFSVFFFHISYEIGTHQASLMLICVYVVVYSCSALPEVRPPTEVGSRMSSTLLESVSLCLFAVSFCQLPWKLIVCLLYVLMVRRS